MFRKVAFAGVVLTGLMVSGASAANNLGTHWGADCGLWIDEPCFGPREFSQWREDELGFRTSCEDAMGTVRDLGYRKVRAAKCGVRVHNVTGWRGKHRYLIKVNGYNGNVNSIQRLD